MFSMTLLVGRELPSGNTGRPILGMVQTDAAINPGRNRWVALATS
jgi:hypothetical protein